MKNSLITITDNSVLPALNHLAAVFSRGLDPLELMAVSVQELRKIFNADRVWLVYPCDPNSPECRVCYEATRPEYPGLFSEDGRLDVSPGVAELFRDALASDEPIIQIQGSGKDYDLDTVNRFGIRSRMSIALKMQNDRPWLLGLHQCDHRRKWTETEIALFQYAGQRLCETYNSRSILNTIKRDIAKRQKIEAELTRSEYRFRALFKHSSVSLWLEDVTGIMDDFARFRSHGIQDLNGYLERNPEYLAHALAKIKVLDVNQASVDLFEADSKNQLLENIRKLFTEKTRDVFQSVLVALYNESNHLTFEVPYRTLKGNFIDTLLTTDILPDPESHMLLATVVDITGQKGAERRYLESRERYRLLMETANDAIFVTDAETGIILDANNRAGELTGLAVNELVGMQQVEIYSAGEQSRYLEFFFSLNSQQQEESFETLIQNVDGSKIPVEVSSSRTYIDGREVVQSILHDISRRIKREEQQRLLATVVDQVAESVVITDTEGTIEYVNLAFERISGYSRQEVMGRTPNILSNGTTKRQVYKMLWQELKKGNVWHGVFSNRAKDGRLFKEEATITPVRDTAGIIRHYVGVKRDITRQAMVEKQVRQAQKMQAIGTLAGGIAHDFNNILTSIMGFAELSLLQCKDNLLLENNILEIIRGADRAGKLISQILTFSRQTEKNVAALRLSVVIKEALKLLRASLPANIEIIQDIDTEVMVRADPTQMHQVVMNLCTNAYQSVTSDRGWIKVSLKSVLVAAKEGVEIGNLSPGKYVCLKVKDNGIGISAEYLARIFEPYFTTREKNEGTGLGLSVVHGIVNDHGGAVTVDSITGQGSCFTVYLPEISRRESTERQRNHELLTGEGRVLVVDDEQQIVDYEVQVLQRVGYDTNGFTDSLTARDALLAEPERYDLVITDMAMPKMTGLQLFREIRKVRSDLPVLLCTGYSEQVTAKSSREMGINGYLAKPFTAEQFAVEVKRVIESVE